MTNSEIGNILREIAAYLEMQNVPFKPRAYEKAAEAVADLSENLEDRYKEKGIKGLEEIAGVGRSIAEKIEELLKAGRLPYYEKLKAKTPVRISELMRIEGLGPRSIKKLYESLKIKTVEELERAAHAGKVAVLPGFGKKKETNILEGIEFIKGSGNRRTLGSVMPLLRPLEAALRARPEVKKLTVAGSVRRRKETVGDIDILIVSDTPAPVMDFFVHMPQVARVHAHGETKSSIQLSSGIDVDLRIVPEKSYGAALNYFTGSKDHNVALRAIALKKKLKLNEYGLFRRTKAVAGATEEELYRALGMEYIPPELRENTGEIEWAIAHKLPKLIGYDNLQGDLQVQTDWTDGSASIEEMAQAAMKRGLSYIAITDHTKRLAMTRGLDEKRLLKQMSEIDRVNKKLKGKMTILKGTECDILKNGSLDLSDEVLSKLDVVGVSVHSHFGLSKKEQTERILRAMENPHVDILFHPTGRIIGRRPAYDVDLDAVMHTALTRNVALEIDAHPERLDLKDDHIRKCVEKGVAMTIDSDAHAPSHFAYLEYGIAQARRGWAEKHAILNTYPAREFLRRLS